MQDWVRIGIIYPASGLADFEFYEMAPKNVTVHVTRIPLERSTPKCLGKLADYAEDVAVLLAQAKVNVIAFCCTAGSFIGGPGFDREVIRKIEKSARIPATTTSTAVLSALDRLGARKLVVATPYIDEVNWLEKKFLEANGFSVIKIEGLKLLNSYAIGLVKSERLHELVKRVYTPKADVIFISCGGLRTINIIEEFEEKFRIPIITSNQATMWAALRMAGIKTPIKGFGKLLRQY